MLLNNDAVVTDGWLDQLIALTRIRAESRERGDPAPDGSAGRAAAGTGVGGPIDLVGPMSNYASPPQLVEGVPYRDLDERFGTGFFDDDLAERARRAGFELAVAHDLFVHHFGSRTFVGAGIDAGRLLEENERRFADKWGRDRTAGRRVALRAWSDVPDLFADVQRRFARDVDEPVPVRGPASDGRRRVARVSLTMIVRDEEENLPHCLESARGIFGEVVVDTGSADRTREIARSFGAQVVEFDWIGDFAAARNVAMEHAAGGYAFWLDADDVIESDQREKVIALLNRLEPRGAAAYVVRCACDPGADGSGGQTVVDHIRLFPIRPDVRWTYRVHEQIPPALRRAGIPVRWTDLVVRHTGYVDVALRTRKLERDRRILLEELEGRPDEPFLLFNLGAIAVEQKDWRGDLNYLGRSLAPSAPSDSITRKLFALIARAHQMLGDSEAALRVCGEGLAMDPQDAELRFRAAVLHRHRGEREEAERCWRAILGLRRPETFASVDMGIYGHLTRRNLAAMAAERGDAEEEARHWRAVLAECPDDREALARIERLAAARSSQPAR